jgi:hypothetical protein
MGIVAGMIEKPTSEQLKHEKDQRHRMRWLAEQRKQAAERDKAPKVPHRPPHTVCRDVCACVYERERT